MIATGLAFATSSTYAVVLLVAFVGTINPSSGSVSIFVPLEHAVLSRSVADADRTRMFARYGLIGALAAAVGALASASPDLLASWAYRTRGAQAMFVALCRARPGRRPPVRAHSARTDACRLTNRSPHSGRRAASSTRWRPFQHRRLRRRLCRAVAGRVVAVQQVRPFALGGRPFFFWSGVLAAFSFPVAAWLSRRIGLVNTMVFTHIPSSLCLILAAVAPSLEVALGLLLVRAALRRWMCRPAPPT